MSLILILALRMSADATGLVLPRRNVRIGAIALVPLIMLGVVLGVVYKPDPPTAEMLAFQLLMPGAALWTLSGGFVYGWLRFSTGSLLFPLIAHSLTNVAFQLAPLIGA